MNLSAEVDGHRSSPISRRNSFTTATATGANPSMTKPSSRHLAPSSSGALTGNALYDPGQESFDGSSGGTGSERPEETRWGGSDTHEYGDHSSDQHGWGGR